MKQGYLSLILHAHLPFVRHPEYDDFLEEDWLYEAITETYLPILDAMQSMARDGVYFRLTFSMTPPLCAMLRDELLINRYTRYLDRLIELSGKEIERTRHGDGRFHELAWFYHSRFLHLRYVYHDICHRDIVGAFKVLQDSGHIEIITCGATHGFLPLMADYPEAVRAQILIARDDYRYHFGRDPRGIWLPECAYTPGIERFLQEAEIRWFVLDSHGILFADPQPRFGVFAPIFTRFGPAAFGRDHESSKQVWSAEEGYPGDFCYRDFYRDIGFDLDDATIRPYVQQNGLRKFTGIKYYRITGKSNHKEPYHRGAAIELAARHAGNFMFNRERQIEHLAGVMGADVPPIIISPYDAELFGHWWFEGPDFIHFFLRKAAYDQHVFETITPSEYLQRHNTHQLATPSASSWGNKGYWEVWLEDSNSWIYPHLHMAATRMIELARRFKDAPISHQLDRALRQAARELLLAQSSDWAFIMKTGTAVQYAVKRTRDHILRFTRLYEQILSGQIDDAFLGNCEWRDNLFPHLNWRYYI